MSKSLGNIVGTDTMVEQYGADTGRLFVLFAAPPEKDLDWNDSGVEGMYRFLSRVYRFVTRNAGAGGEDTGADTQALRRLHQTIKQVTEDFETRWHFNTSISAVMKLLNDVQPVEGQLSRAALREISEKMTLLLAPFVPFLAQELWEEIGGAGQAFQQAWPCYDPDLAREEEAEIPVQVNGKLRGRIWAPFGAPREELERRALADEKVQAFLQGKQPRKTIVVPDKLVNLVV
jgi:leucyl-tRNA synthetase